MPSCELLKFARDTSAPTIVFDCDGVLRIRAESDVVTSECAVAPFDDPCGPPVSGAPSTIACTTRNVVSIAKAALFSKAVIITVCANEVLFVYRKDLAAHVSFLLAQAV